MSYSDKYNSAQERNSFGLFIKEQRSLKRMTQNELGKVLGLARTVIARVEINAIPFNYKKLDKLAEIFGTDLTEVKLRFYSWHFTSLIKERGCPSKAPDLAKENFKKPDLK